MGWYEDSLFGPIAADIAANAPTGAALLEVGCGWGPLSLRLATHHNLDLGAEQRVIPTAERRFGDRRQPLQRRGV